MRDLPHPSRGRGPLLQIINYPLQALRIEALQQLK
jgi:hypothetical protein